MSNPKEVAAQSLAIPNEKNVRFPKNEVNSFNFFENWNFSCITFEQNESLQSIINSFNN